MSIFKLKEYGYSIDEVEQMYPFETTLFFEMIKADVEQKKKRQQQSG